MTRTTQMLKPFGVKLHYTDQHRLSPQVEKELGATYHPTMADLVTKASLVSLSLLGGTGGQFRVVNPPLSLSLTFSLPHQPPNQSFRLGRRGDAELPSLPGHAAHVQREAPPLHAPGVLHRQQRARQGKKKRRAKAPGRWTCMCTDTTIKHQTKQFVKSTNPLCFCNKHKHKHKRS